MGTFFSSLRCLRRFPPTRRPNNRTPHPTEGGEAIHHQSPEHIPLARYAGHTSHLFALIIGINGYTNCRGLRGAAADAEAMKDYLREAFGVSKDHIRMLLDYQATREAIIKAFRDLRNDPHIRKGDPILIFFAGHGAELYAPTEWCIKSKIQWLLPYDYEDKRTHPIPDRTIGALIDDIAKMKGNNITVIFDCCFAAGCARNENEEYVPRTVDLDPNILIEVRDLDQDILEDRHGVIPNGFASQGVRSHVLLAACGEKELAYEHNKRGLFTSALLTMLKDCAVNDFTYAEVIERIHLDSQNPRCVGSNQQRVLFDARVPAGRRVLYPTQVNSMGNFVVGAGLAHGVSHGVQFILYDNRRMISGVVVVDDDAAIEDFQTTLTISEEHLRDAAFAKLTRVGEVSFYLAQGGSCSPILNETLRRMAGNGTRVPNLRIVEQPKEAKLEVAMEDDLVVFRILDQRVKRFGLTKLPYTATLDTVAHVLSAAAHYYWYLHTNSRVGTNRKVVVNFYLLKKEYDEDGLPYRVPVKPGFCRKDPVDNSDVIDFVVDPGASYGIEIKNNTARDLYLNAFLFNNSSLRILPYCIQSSGGNPEAPLKQNGTFTIGYGTSGERPFTYWLDEDQDVDVGYLKLFFATRPIDLTDIVQVSPFPDLNKQSKTGGDAREGGPILEESDVEDIWFTEVIPVVQRRRGMPAAR